MSDPRPTGRADCEGRGPEVVTFGCRLNSFESEIIVRHAHAAGLDDAVIIHTCAVTAEAERQARQAIRRARRENPEKRIIVTGCSVQIDPDGYRAMKEVDHLLGNHDKLLPSAWRALAGGSELVVQDIMQVRETASHLVDGFDGRSRAFVQVQQGCDHRCTFCVIPLGRGNNRSIAVDQVIEQSRRLLDNGYQEIVLTGVDIASWGRDMGEQSRLGDLVERLLAELPGLARLRLTSLDPAAIDPLLFELLAGHDRVMPHVHLSLQAGDDMILKRMKRRHLRGDVIELCGRLRERRPELAFGADMIAGFPTETDAMFEQSLAIVDEAGLTFLHVFPYSPRPSTPAARMPQVARQVVKERAARLRSVGEECLARFLAGQVGTKRQVLVERGNRGHTQHFAPVRLTTPADGGTLRDVAIEAVDQHMLVGSVIE
ncbi:MAG: tRNA (N(6)-L-threonylcarbamoyladenosine(37)-C(2))-methylthiotransferase MtaB [Geminicoccaceae bacterium]|nr:tRNA (N(6)-L-threonylcarbamoyladenosine(37)-C(2))-methylthiotransferase MtaB [Geminicoccaceae bacterium]MCB9942626.1 tRNA (N(6)-L-threonylcarbamoyladenosine(37)-C(2))-methylthiotransferase MtaB [Geminicoccaceae bacterium]